MKKHIAGITIACLAVLLLLQGCDPIETETPPPPRLVLILCDLSSSIDTVNTRKDIQKTTNDILNSLPPGTVYELYPATDKPEKDIYSSDTGDDDSTQTIKRNIGRFKKCIEALNTAYSNTNSNATCLIDAIESVAGRIKIATKTHSYSRIDLLILSDMLEVCATNNIHLNFEQQVDTAKAYRMLREWPENRKPFLNDSNLKIAVIYSTGQQSQHHLLMDFWSRYFQAAGHNGGLSFSPVFKPEMLAE